MQNIKLFILRQDWFLVIILFDYHLDLIRSTRDKRIEECYVCLFLIDLDGEYLFYDFVFTVCINPKIIPSLELAGCLGLTAF